MNIEHNGSKSHILHWYEKVEKGWKSDKSYIGRILVTYQKEYKSQIPLRGTYHSM